VVRLSFGSIIMRLLMRSLIGLAGLWLCSGVSALAQAGAAQFDYAQMSLDQQSKEAKKTEEQRAQNKALVDSGAFSALDLEAPNNAVEEFNRASSLIKAQNSKEAMKHLQKAIHDYPKFVSAHIGLGLAYIDQEDPDRARSEFEAAAKLDDKFPGSFLNLGRLALSLNDFGTAQSQLEKAASRHPKDPKILLDLANAQNGNHQYQHCLETAQQVHALEHKGMANVHYVAAAAAIAMHNFDVMEHELTLFLTEDPTNPFAPAARKNLDALSRSKTLKAADPASPLLADAKIASLGPQTFPNSDRLKAQLSAVGDESDGGSCVDCGTLADANPAVEGGHGGPSVAALPGLSDGARGVWTIRKSVDDVAVFFAVSSHGHMINDLEASDIQILDDNKPPAKVLQFTPQSKLPLRLALLIDTSGSVHERFMFEKRAAAKFIQKMVSSGSDLGFVAGFNTETNVTQDFSADTGELGHGIEKLTNGGGTALFDAVSLACRKLAAYPESERVARVLVILTDGEDNSSHNSLKQSLQAVERSGVTVYTVSTREDQGSKTDADKVLEVLADRSGGRAMFPGDIFTLGSSFDKLRDVIRSRYFIAYKPADFQPNGSYRAIRITAEKNGKRLQVRAQKGYHARLEARPN
jgi:Ca-activated chloride channel family protein